eukprot:Seg3938.1 transcript_id=Seg3938.1/GoldUCD/mRNA.D3Y31 product="Forkhead box protein I1-B" protein_id=Seg3938.1/GoldUCD/D3Y31
MFANIMTELESLQHTNKTTEITMKDDSFNSLIGSSTDKSSMHQPIKCVEATAGDKNNHEEGVSTTNSFPSYTEMIATILLSERPAAKTLQEIYNFMEKRYPFLKQRGASWKNSVRHTLSLSECFVKMPRLDSGRRCDWTVHPVYLHQFSCGNFKKPRQMKKNLRGAKATKGPCSKTQFENKLTPNGCFTPRNQCRYSSPHVVHHYPEYRFIDRCPILGRNQPGRIPPLPPHPSYQNASSEFLELPHPTRGCYKLCHYPSIETNCHDTLRLSAHDRFARSNGFENAEAFSQSQQMFPISSDFQDFLAGLYFKNFVDVSNLS